MVIHSQKSDLEGKLYCLLGLGAPSTGFLLEPGARVWGTLPLVFSLSGGAQLEGEHTNANAERLLVPAGVAHCHSRTFKLEAERGPDIAAPSLFSSTFLHSYHYSKRPLTA